MIRYKKDNAKTDPARISVEARLCLQSCNAIRQIDRISVAMCDSVKRIIGKLCLHPRIPLKENGFNGIAGHPGCPPISRECPLNRWCGAG